MTVLFVLARLLCGVLIGAPAAADTAQSCVCGHPRSDHADADYTGLTWCTGDCGCSMFQQFTPERWWGVL